MTKLFNSLEEATSKIPLQKSILVVATNEKGNNIKICISHTKEGFFAIQNACSHSGADLYKGFINEQNEIVCPLHSYCFDLKTGSSTRGNAAPLKIYKLEWKLDSKTNQKALFIDF